MGCGKTSVGKALKAYLGCEFFDLDDEIEKKFSMRIPEIFEIHGETYFRNCEHEVVLEFSKMHGVILATGGGALTFPRNVAALKACHIVYLKLDFDECYRRILGSDRPLLQLNTREKLSELFQAREPLYSSVATLTLDAANEPCEIAAAIIKSLGLHQSI